MIALGVEQKYCILIPLPVDSKRYQHPHYHFCIFVFFGTHLANLSLQYQDAGLLDYLINDQSSRRLHFRHPRSVASTSTLDTHLFAYSATKRLYLRV